MKSKLESCMHKRYQVISFGIYSLYKETEKIKLNLNYNNLSLVWDIKTGA